MVAIFATQWDKFISSTLSGTCCPMDPYFISSMGPWICFPSTRGGTGGITTPYHSCEDGWRFVVTPWFRQKPPPPPSIAVAMWHLWCLLGQCAGELFDVNVSGLKKTNISTLQKCHGILELVPSTSAWIIRYIISHHPIISVSHLWIIIRSLVGVKMPQEAQVLLGFMPESFRDLAVLNGCGPKLSIVW